MHTLINIFICGFMFLGADEGSTLKSVFKDDFLVGAAINQNEINGTDRISDEIIIREFNSITPENALKWVNIHPQRDVYDFKLADQYVEFGERNNMFIVGHTLVWYQDTPKWVYENDKGVEVDRETLLKRMKDHIFTVVGRYKGRIKGWDVVNEALADNGELRPSFWLRIIGDDYIAKAFEYAHEADPDAELYYNDYELENEPKQKGAIKIVQSLQAKKIPIKSIGIQSHDKMETPSIDKIETAIVNFGKLGLKVSISELDIDILPEAFKYLNAPNYEELKKTELNPYRDGLPKKVEQALAKRYGELFKLFLKHKEIIERVTFWGVTDKDSWLNDWPIKGRTNFPLLFDREGKKKTAYESVISIKV